jgi:hypothetical protein
MKARAPRSAAGKDERARVGGPSVVIARFAGVQETVAFANSLILRTSVAIPWRLAIASAV